MKFQISNAKGFIRAPYFGAGFTLIELLVTISIIAVLTVIGMVAYGNVQKNVRDARRKADIDAIANAMEANYGKTTTGQYSPLSGTFFSSGAIPADPDSSKSYCFRQGPILTDAEAGACDDTAATGAGDNIAEGKPAGAGNVYWVVCANLESTTPPDYYCRANIQ